MLPSTLHGPGGLRAVDEDFDPHDPLHQWTMQQQAIHDAAEAQRRAANKEQSIRDAEIAAREQLIEESESKLIAEQIAQDEELARIFQRQIKPQDIETQFDPAFGTIQTLLFIHIFLERPSHQRPKPSGEPLKKKQRTDPTPRSIVPDTNIPIDLPSANPKPSMPSFYPIYWGRNGHFFSMLPGISNRNPSSTVQYYNVEVNNVSWPKRNFVEIVYNLSSINKD